MCKRVTGETWRQILVSFSLSSIQTKRKESMPKASPHQRKTSTMIKRMSLHHPSVTRGSLLRQEDVRSRLFCSDSPYCRLFIPILLYIGRIPPTRIDRGQEGLYRPVMKNIMSRNTAITFFKLIMDYLSLHQRPCRQCQKSLGQISSILHVLLGLSSTTAATC